MARLARLWITASDVIRDRPAEFCGALPVRSVASVAGGGIERVVVAHMTGGAGRRHRGDVHPGQGEPRNAVIERRSVPAPRCMARGTVRWSKSRSGSTMHRIARLLPCGQMAT